MSTLAMLDDCLSQDYSVDYWSDDVILYAHTLIGPLTSDDWDALNRIWRQKPLQWQRYLAQILPHGELRYALPLMIQMLDAADGELLVTVADGLRDLDRQQVAGALDQGHRTRLAALAKTRSTLEARTIHRLLQYIQNDILG